MSTLATIASGAATTDGGRPGPQRCAHEGAPPTGTAATSADIALTRASDLDVCGAHLIYEQEVGRRQGQNRYQTLARIHALGRPNRVTRHGAFAGGVGCG